MVIKHWGQQKITILKRLKKIVEKHSGGVVF